MKKNTKSLRLPHFEHASFVTVRGEIRQCPLTTVSLTTTFSRWFDLYNKIILNHVHTYLQVIINQIKPFRFLDL